MVSKKLFMTKNSPESYSYPDSKVHGANMGHIWGRQDPGGPHVGPINFAIWVVTVFQKGYFKDRAHLSTFKFFIFEKFSCFVVLVVFLVIVQSSELISM